MRSYLRNSAILSMAVAAVAWNTAALRADDVPNTTDVHVRQTTDNVQDTAHNGIKATADQARTITNETVDAPTAALIDTRLVSIVNSAVSNNGFTALIGSFDKPTRDRLGTENCKDFDKLNVAIDQFRKDFHEKYNEDFDLKVALFTNIPVYMGSDKNYARVALSSFQAGNTGADKSKEVEAKSLLAAGNKNARPINVGGLPGADINRNANVTPPVAVVSSATPDPASADARPGDLAIENMDLNLITESMIGNGWRLQVPPALSARDLRDALSTELAAMCSMKDQWPTDIDQAYMKVSKHIFKTIENTQPPSVTAENR